MFVLRGVFCACVACTGATTLLRLAILEFSCPANKHFDH